MSLKEFSLSMLSTFLIINDLKLSMPSFDEVTALSEVL